MNTKRLFAGLLASMMVFSTACSNVSYAAESNDTTQTTSQTGTQSATLSYDQDSSFTVTIPKTIALGSAKSATYNVNVKGDINANDVITVIPDSSIVMKDSKGKSDVSATITQEKTEFLQTEIVDDGNDTTGNISASKLTAGDWSGTLNFAINIEKKEVSTAGGVALYDENDVLLASAEESGIDISKDYTESTYKTEETSGYYIDRKYPTAVKAVISDGTTTIGNYAFYECGSLTTIEIPDSVETIGDNAFFNNGFETISIPNSVTSIGKSAFHNCQNLSSVVIPDSIYFISDKTFYGCGRLNSVTIPEGVSEIGAHAFEFCGLNTISIPGSVTSIDDSAFEQCHDLTSINLSYGINSIGKFAFSGCAQLKSITIPDSVTSIENGAFSECSALDSITIPSSVFSMGDSIFAGCMSLHSVVLPDNIFTIYNHVFERCNSLSSITLPNTLSSIETGAFSECRLLYTVKYQGKTYRGSKSALISALKAGGVSFSDSEFDNTGFM